MRIEKELLKNHVAEALKRSYFIVFIDFTGLKVSVFSELRKRLKAVNCRCLVSKNTLIRMALNEIKPEAVLAENIFKGPTAVLTSEEKDATAVAKILKNFIAEFQLPKIKSAIIENAVLYETDFLKLADLPGLEVLRSQVLLTLQSTGTRLVRLINEPASALARLIEKYSKKEN
ncbi:50S ribosomal protein L10 [Candidatus Methylacidiphilum infernorum]|uniref:Large ribosomal subunit protein uL10 n=1 Tax=Methylacidiphilum infernorum (isolate V4) TaxID=481448 RepID=B3E161_METI4|nr:50S ribosomal protein L10 [Candidatus Methylacidiphilum infernorum]ACD82857.1 Ribosomal protein L10 [Methylacidiphilum infernorum V4]